MPWKWRIPPFSASLAFRSQFTAPHGHTTEPWSVGKRQAWISSSWIRLPSSIPSFLSSSPLFIPRKPSSTPQQESSETISPPDSFAPTWHPLPRLASSLAHARGLLRVPAAQPVGHSLRGDGHGQPRRGRLSGLLLQGGRRRRRRSAHRRSPQERSLRGGQSAGRAGQHSGVSAFGGSVGGTDGRRGAGSVVRFRGIVHGVVLAARRGGEEEICGGAGGGESGGVGEMQSDL